MLKRSGNARMSDNQFNQLEANLYRIPNKHACLHQRYSLLNLGVDNYKRWLDETLLPRTRLIVEPKITGAAITVYYERGQLIKAINKEGLNKIQVIRKIRNVPIQLPIKKSIQIRGTLYAPNLDMVRSEDISIKFLYKRMSANVALAFCSFQIINSNQNQYQSLQELQKLNFEVPETEFTNFTSEVELYVKLWKEGKLFTKYPTNGIVLKINSKKLQKQLGNRKSCFNWAYSIKN